MRSSREVGSVVIGGDGAANVAIDGWPQAALRLWVAQGELSAELGAAAVHGDTERASGAHVTLHDGDSLELLRHTFVVE